MLFPPGDGCALPPPPRNRHVRVNPGEPAGGRLCHVWGCPRLCDLGGNVLQVAVGVLRHVSQDVECLLAGQTPVGHEHADRDADLPVALQGRYEVLRPLLRLGGRHEEGAMRGQEPGTVHVRLSEGVGLGGEHVQSGDGVGPVQQVQPQGQHAVDAETLVGLLSERAPSRLCGHVPGDEDAVLENSVDAWPAAVLVLQPVHADGSRGTARHRLELAATERGHAGPVGGREETDRLLDEQLQTHTGVVVAGVPRRWPRTSAVLRRSS